MTVVSTPLKITGMTGHRESEAIIKNITELCELYNAATLYVFGSQAKPVWDWAKGGKPLQLSSGHDVDFGVKLIPNHTLTTQQFVMFAQALEDLLGVPRVDLINLEEVDPFLAANIIRGERLYAADKHAADEYELYVLRRAGDLAPFEKMRQQMILEGKKR